MRALLSLALTLCFTAPAFCEEVKIYAAAVVKLAPRLRLASIPLYSCAAL